LIENLNYSGLWWLPSNDNQKVWGTLTFSSQDGASLILWDSLKEQDFREITEAEIILGKAYDHKIITLYKTNCISIRNDELEYRKSQYEIKYIFLGRHIQNPSDIKFRKIRIQYSDIREWIGKRNQSLGFFSSKEGKEDWTINYRKGAPSKVQIKDESLGNETSLNFIINKLFFDYYIL
jgi:ApeA N-terminal domain 1